MEIGTEILLKRIKDCPEEFEFQDIHGIGRWARVLQAAQDCLPLDEFEAIKNAIAKSRKQYMLDKFNEQVLKTLAGENTQEDEIGKTAYTGNGTASQQLYGQGWTDPRGVLSQGGMLNASKVMGEIQQQYNTIQKAESARNAAMQQAQSGSGLLGKLGFGRLF